MRKTRREMCEEVFAVYADYDGNAPDTADLALFTTQDLAQVAAKIGNDGVEEVPLHTYVEGCEQYKDYTVRRVWLPVNPLSVVQMEVFDSIKSWVESDC